MSEHKHTPWTHHRGEDYTTFYDSEENEIFTVHYQMPEELARLIAAAPELAIALDKERVAIDELFKELGNKVSGDWGIINDGLVAGAAALAKVKPPNQTGVTP